MYVGIAPPRSGRRAYTGGLVVIQQCRAEKEERRNHEDREERRYSQGRGARRTKREEQHVGGDQAHEGERDEGGDRMGEVRPRKLGSTPERDPVFERDHGDDQAAVPEPRNRRQEAEDAEEAK
jgi:hypothetical protein